MNAVLAVVVFWMFVLTAAVTFIITLEVATPDLEHVTVMQKTLEPLK